MTNTERTTEMQLTRATRLLLTLAVSGIAFFGPVPEANADQTVRVTEPDPKKADTFKFEPVDITVKVGETVLWKWEGDDKHSVTSDTGVFDSGELKGRGKEWKFQFTRGGDYPYSCTPHTNMTGMVRVK
jgi:plastocyanin